MFSQNPPMTQHVIGGVMLTAEVTLYHISAAAGSNHLLVRDQRQQQQQEEAQSHILVGASEPAAFEGQAWIVGPIAGHRSQRAP
jgi:hypothetical protein